jgi:hypothetical protein
MPLRHPALALVVSTLFILPSGAADAKPKDDKGAVKAPQWYELMDYGPFLADTILAPGDNTAIKGVAVAFGNDGKAGGMCYDLDLLRVSAAWSGGFLRFTGDAYDRKHSRGPEVVRPLAFATTAGPGWAKGGSFADPRSEPYGPLPRDWARFTGLYRHGQRVVLSYRVGTATVLELPGLTADGVFTRTFAISDLEPAQLLVAEVAGGKGSVADGVTTLAGEKSHLRARVIGAPGGAKLTSDGGRLVLHLPAMKEGLFTLALGSGDTPVATAAAGSDPRTLITGGPARWGATLTTTGSRGNDSGAYAVDTISMPTSNPWGANLRFAGLDFFADGRAALSTWNGDVWIVDGLDADLAAVTWRRFAGGMHQPLGLKVVDGIVHVLCRNGLWRLKDLDQDGEADFYELFNGDIHATPAFHEFAFDLHTDQDGNFYHTKSGPVKQGGRGWETIAEHHGSVIRISRDGQTLERFATGFRAPNGMGVGPQGQVTSGDNEGTWMPVCRLNYIRKGGFSGVMDLHHRTVPPTIYDPPICFIPHKIDNSSGAQVWPMDQRWGPLAGNLLHLSYGTCSVFVVAWGMEGDVPQGGMTRLPLSFNTGIMRARVSPKDGQVYVCGLKGWQTTGSKDGGFQRIRATGKAACIPVGMRVHRNGIALTFSDALDPALAKDVGNWTGEQWNYLWTANYGSPEVKPGGTQPGHDPLPISTVTLSADGRTAFLEIAGLKPVMQFSLKYKLASAAGDEVNVVPDKAGP